MFCTWTVVEPSRCQNPTLFLGSGLTASFPFPSSFDFPFDVLDEEGGSGTAKVAEDLDGVGRGAGWEAGGAGTCVRLARFDGLDVVPACKQGGARVTQLC